MKRTVVERSLEETVSATFWSLKYLLSKGFDWTVKNFFYELTKPFVDFEPKYFVSTGLVKFTNALDFLTKARYEKSKVYRAFKTLGVAVHEEHMTPNSQFMKALLACPGPVEFGRFVRENYAVAIVTKEENSSLDKKYKTDRPDLEAAFRAYEDVGISLVPVSFGRLT
jgi:hypothetical protein